MPKGDSQERKAQYFEKLIALVDEYPKILIVQADNVGSNQLHQVRQGIRGDSVMLMGKNTMVRKALRGHLENNPELENLLPYVRGNVGFVFTKGDLKDVRKKLTANKVAAPAKAGAVSPVDVKVPAGNTSQPPEKTSFFQALGIATKITRGSVEIINEVHLLKPGDKVGQSEAALLNMLKISPFAYGLRVLQVYENGSVFDPSILDISDDDLLNTAMAAIRNIASISLAINHPTAAAVPHLVANAIKNVFSVALATEYTFPALEKVKKAAAAAPVHAAPVAASAAPAKAAAKEVKKEESEEEDMGMGLFD